MSLVHDGVRSFNPTAPGIAGPIVPAVAICEWCGTTVTLDADRDVWVDAAGKVTCTPEARGATCAWAFYRAEGIEPTTLLNHDSACTCQFSFPHLGGRSAPYTGAVPVCCGRPMRGMSADWRCRERCGRVVRPGERCEVYAPLATAPGTVTRTWHGPHPHRGITEAEVAGPGAVNTARSRTATSTPYPLSAEGGAAVAPPKPDPEAEHNRAVCSARATAEVRTDGGEVHGRRAAHPRPPVQTWVRE